MNNQPLIDTVDDDKEIQQIVTARTSFAAALDRNNLLDILREIVDGSTCLDFTSARTRRFISPGRPELLLAFDPVATIAKYPQYAFAVDGSVAMELKEIRKARDMIVQNEITNNLVDFFTATFKYVMDGKIPDAYTRFESHVHRVIAEKDTAYLRNHILDIFELRDGDGNPTGAMTFIFSITSATAHSSDDELIDDLSCAIELAY